MYTVEKCPSNLKYIPYIIHLLRLDPDATESSSGGESADEHDKYPSGATFYAPIRERAKYRWLKKVSYFIRYIIFEYSV